MSQHSAEQLETHLSTIATTVPANASDVMDEQVAEGHIRAATREQLQRLSALIQACIKRVETLSPAPANKVQILERLNALRTRIDARLKENTQYTELAAHGAGEAMRAPEEIVRYAQNRNVSTGEKILAGLGGIAAIAGIGYVINKFWNAKTDRGIGSGPVAKFFKFLAITVGTLGLGWAAKAAFEYRNNQNPDRPTAVTPEEQTRIEAALRLNGQGTDAIPVAVPTVSGTPDPLINVSLLQLTRPLQLNATYNVRFEGSPGNIRMIRSNRDGTGTSLTTTIGAIHTDQNGEFVIRNRDNVTAYFTREQFIANLNGAAVGSASWNGYAQPRGTAARDADTSRPDARQVLPLTFAAGSASAPPT